MLSRPMLSKTFCVLACLALAAPLACSSDSDSSGTKDSGPGAEVGTPDKEAGPISGGTITGMIKDAEGNGVGDATVKAGTVSVTADFKGNYELKGVPAGEVTVTVSAAWYTTAEDKATVTDGESTTLDLVIAARELKIDDADRALADEYNKTFDWTKDTLSISVVKGPTKKDLENAVWFRNPALYRDTSAEDKVSPKPLIGANGGKGFDFPVGDKQALDEASIVDSLDKTPIPAGERESWVTWERMLKFAKGWDISKVKALVGVGAAIRQQQWGGNGVAPQSLERVWLHNDEIWVSVVFEGFAETGKGVSDSDGDGRMEVYAKISGDHYTKEVVDKVRDDYLNAGKLNTLQLKEVVDDIINDLYDATDPKVESTVGVPFTVPDKGDLAYPFVVFKHADGKQNVLLVGP